jgi:serine/threonine-protein kinase
LLTIHGSPALFAEHFGVAEVVLQSVPSDSSLELEPPGDIRDFVEAITLTQAPTEDGVDAPTADSRQGTLIGSTIGRFTITARLGAGAMGEVYRAEDNELKRTVAIKRLAPGRHETGDSRNELLKEGRRASTLNHPRIASIYDVVTIAGASYLVMEYVDGSTLRERLESPLGIAECCRIGLQCTEALAAAHEKGILHGDVKPGNIMLTRAHADVKVCDFGLARRLPGAATPVDSTVSLGLMRGTPAYMAPEVILDSSVSARADMFSLGVVFYEMLSGTNPFRAADQFSSLDRILTVSPQSLHQVNPEIPRPLARLVGRMIEKDPSNRYANLVEVREELSSIAARLPVSKKPVSGTWLRLRSTAIASVLVGATFLAGVQHWDGRGAPPVVIPAEVNLAVLPFETSGDAQSRQFFVQGLTEVLNQQLSKLTVDRAFQVATVFELRARHVVTPTDAREQLGSNLVLTGLLHYSGNRATITCRLIDTRSGRDLRNETLTLDAKNSMYVRDRVVDAAIRLVGLHLKPSERSAVVIRDTQQPGAYDFYVQARGYLLNYDRLENLDSAISVFRRALDLDPRYALAYAGLGEAYWRKHELTGAAIWVEPARAACEGALAITPNQAEPHACLGMVLNGTGLYGKAISEFDVALDIEPTNDGSYLGLATAYEKLGRAAEAERTYLRAIEVRPHYWGAYNTLGGYYYRFGRFDEALRMFQQVVALAPDSFRGHSSLGAVYFMKDRTAEAVDAFQKSLAIKPNYVAASNLGTLYFYEGEYVRSVQGFRQALSLDEGNYIVWGNLAGALEGAGQASEASAAYRRARELALDRLTVNPNDPALHMAVADYHAALGDTASARASLANVIKLAPADAHTLFELAVFFEFRLRQRDDALKWLRKALEHGQTWREVDRLPTLRDLRKDPRFAQMRHGDGGAS